MKGNQKSYMTYGAIGALAGMILVPTLSAKARRKVTRTARNAYFKASDFVQDIIVRSK